MVFFLVMSFLSGSRTTRAEKSNLNFVQKKASFAVCVYIVGVLKICNSFL